MNIDDIRKLEQEAMEADYVARRQVARYEAIHNALNTATRLYLDQLVAPWLALAAVMRAERRGRS